MRNELLLIATYRRTLHASLERVWENVLDWEHLPWLHRSAFIAAELVEQTPAMWRAWVTLAPAERGKRALIEIQTDMSNLRYWSRTRDGQGAGSEVLTLLSPVDEWTTNVVVEFRTPVLPPEKVRAVGEAYLRLYQRLWDEDERMMMRKQTLIDKGWCGKRESRGTVRESSLRRE
jgi:predicted Rdx family selenoprotein